MSQSLIDKGGRWVRVEIPKDENIIELGVGQEFIAVFVGSKPNPAFEGELIHVFETDGGNMRMMYGKTNLDRWMKAVEPGSRVKIKRLDDKRTGKAKPLHLFEVYIKEDN